MTSRYHGSKVSGSRLNPSWQRQPIVSPNDGRKVWATVLLLSTIMLRKVTDFNFSFFLLYLRDHYLLRSRNFATIAT